MHTRKKKKIYIKKSSGSHAYSEHKSTSAIKKPINKSPIIEIPNESHKWKFSFKKDSYNTDDEKIPKNFFWIKTNQK
jgi:hypothetical protein